MPLLKSGESAGDKLYAMVYAAIVIVALGTWLNCVGRANVLGLPFDASDWAVFYAGRAAGLIACVVWWRFIARHSAAWMGAGGVVVLVGTIMCYGSRYFPSPVAALGGLALCGFGRTGANACAYILLAQCCGLSVAVWVAAAALAGKNLLSFAVAGMAESTAVVAMFAVPVLVVGCSCMLRGLRISRLAASRARLSGSAKHYAVLLGMVVNVTLFVLTISSSISLAGNVYLYTGAGEADSSPGGGVLASVALFLLLVRPFLVCQLERTLMNRYIPAFVVLAFGTVLAVVVSYPLAPGFAAVVNVVLNAIEFFGHLLLWTIVMDVSQKSGKRSFRAAGCICLAYDILAAVYSVFEGHLESSKLYVAFTALLVGYAILVLSCIVLPSVASGQRFFGHGFWHTVPLRGEEDHADEATRENLDDAFKMRFEYLLELYPFTPREQEIFLLLCKGRNRVVIGSELGITNNTIKTHVNHIYQKMGITSHQELLDVVFNGRT